MGAAMNASDNPPASPHRGWLIWAFLNDLAQRLLTWNKREQRDNLRRVFRQLDPARTGLFAHALAENGPAMSATTSTRILCVTARG